MVDKYEYIVNRSNDFITLINREYVYEIANDTYCDIIGRPKGEVVNRAVAEIWGKERFDRTIRGHLDRCFEGENVHYVERFKFGIEQRYMHVSYYPYSERPGGAITHALVFSHDITKLGEVESKLINYRYRDPLTGLYNRRSLDIILEMEIEKARRSEKEKNRAVMFIGIENMTEVNRKHGHSIGSVLLENTGLRIKETLRASDYVFRYEGTELVVILTSLAKDLHVGKVATKLHDAITTPYRYNDIDITIECRIGASVFPADGETKETLLSNALSALNEAVQLKEPFALFDSEMQQRAEERLRMEGELQHAFEKGQFELYYQPVVDLEGTIRGAEALIRWNNPDRGILPPGEFISLATETGIIELIGRWALFTTARQLAEWNSHYGVYLTVNLTAREFESKELLDVVKTALGQAEGIDASLLRVEITESECMANPEAGIRRIKAIRNLGVEVYIDDFGTGQSSLTYLKDLPVDAFKIDRSFSQGLLGNQEDRAFLETIIHLVKSRNRKVIVEGVSSAEQVAALRGMGCDGLQGYFFSRPVPAATFQGYLDAGGRLPQT